MDGLGTAVACGDFDGAGFSDIAAGVPGEVVRGDRGKGAAEDGDRFGVSVAAGDFDGDGRDDLVVGVPGEGVGGSPRGDVVQVLYGSQNGVSARDDLCERIAAIRQLRDAKL